MSIEDEIERMFSELEGTDEANEDFGAAEFDYCDWYASEVARFVAWRIRNNLTGGYKPPSD